MTRILSFSRCQSSTVSLHIFLFRSEASWPPSRNAVSSLKSRELPSRSARSSGTMNPSFLADAIATCSYWAGLTWGQRSRKRPFPSVYSFSFPFSFWRRLRRRHQFLSVRLDHSGNAVHWSWESGIACTAGEVRVGRRERRAKNQW